MHFPFVLSYILGHPLVYDIRTSFKGNTVGEKKSISSTLGQSKLSNGHKG